MHPQLAGLSQQQLCVEPFSWDLLTERGVKFLFLATPHEQSRALAPEALARGLRVIDLSGAWRLEDPANRAVYKFSDEASPAAAKTQAGAVYGMPELHRAAIANAQLVANPGCYSTTIILALKPLIAAGWVDLEHGIVCDAKSGVSGAGKAPTAKTHFMHAADNLSAYGLFGHRHTGELLEQLDVAADDIVFTPHLLPIPRGILATMYIRFREQHSADEIEACLRSFYAESPMVRVHAAGQSAADPARGAHELLRYRLPARPGWPTMHCHQLSRQPAEGRCRTGGAEPERNVRMAGDGRIAMRYVVKLGGAALENAETLHGCAQAIVEMVRDGHQVAVVHGGGVALTRTLKALGKQSEFVAGLRITDAETRDAALMVLAGRVNKDLVAALGAHGQPAVGLSGGDGLVFRARKKRTAPDLGFVGEIVSSDPRWLEAIWQMGAVPVLSSLALGFDGQYYNINADEMASACAVAARADALVFLTDVPGRARCGRRSDALAFASIRLRRLRVML